MIRHVWSVLCRSSSIDKDSNAFSLFEVLEELTLLQPIKEKGNVPFPMQLATLWSRVADDQPAKAEARILLRLPSGSVIGKSIDFQVDLSTHKRLRHRLNLPGFPVVEEGVHEFSIEVRSSEHEWAEVARVPFTLKVKVPATDKA